MAAFDQMCILGNKSLSRSNLPSGSLPAEKASPEIASGANKICWQKLHSRPGIALFLHNRPTDAIFGSTLAQLLERKVLFARPRYGFFGGQFIPLATSFQVTLNLRKLANFLVLMPSSLSPNNYDHNPRNCEILHSPMPLNASGSLWVHHLVECLMNGRKLIIPGTGLPIIKHVCWRDPGWQGHLDALG